MLIITAIILLCLIALLSIWVYSIHKKFAVLKAEKEDTGLYLKVMELEAKCTALEQLAKDREPKENQIEAASIPLINENNNEKQPVQLKADNHEKIMFINDVVLLVQKKLHKKTEYVELLKHLDKQFFKSLESRYDGNLSVQYVKYCVCFAIGMEISEVSECFSIEQSSVHMVRYRLKKKFGLSNNDDLDLFLRQLKIS